MDQESKVRLIEQIKNLPVVWQPNHKSYGEKRASQLLKYCSSQNTNIVRHFVLFSDYVITIYVITPRAIIATPSVRRTVRRTVRRCVRISPSGGHTSDIPRTYSGQTPDTSMDTGHNPGTVVWTPHNRWQFGTPSTAEQDMRWPLSAKVTQSALELTTSRKARCDTGI